MTINATGRIIDPNRIYSKKALLLVKEYENDKLRRKKLNFVNRCSLKKCSLCSGYMRGDIAKLQIENKRENAPICMACIMGYKRKVKPKYKKSVEFKKFINKNRLYERNLPKI